MKSATRLALAAKVSALCVALLAGCAGNGSGLDANGRPLSSPGSGNLPLTADYASIQQNVFTPICTVCHVGGGAPEGLRLDASNAYLLLVGIPSTEVPAILRVKTGDPDNSYIIQKLEGHAAVGAQMPLGGPPLSAATIAIIRQWITNGAPRSAAAAAASSLHVTAVAPAMGEVLAESPPQVAVGFNGELDATRVDPGSLRLERLGERDGATVIDAVPARLMMPAANVNSLILTPVNRLPAGRYRVVMRGDPGLELADLQSHPLQDGARTEAGDLLITRFDVAAQPAATQPEESQPTEVQP